MSFPQFWGGEDHRFRQWQSHAPWRPWRCGERGRLFFHTSLVNKSRQWIFLWYIHVFSHSICFVSPIYQWLFIMLSSWYWHWWIAMKCGWSFSTAVPLVLGKTYDTGWYMFWWDSAIFQVIQQLTVWWSFKRRQFQVTICLENRCPYATKGSGCVLSGALRIFCSIPLFLWVIYYVTYSGIPTKFLRCLILREKTMTENPLIYSKCCMVLEYESLHLKKKTLTQFCR